MGARMSARRITAAEAQARELRIARRIAAQASFEQLKASLNPPTGEVVLIADATRRFVHAQLDDGYMHRDGGYGGWSEVERPGRVSATVFTGTGPQRLPLRLVLGGRPDPCRSGMPCAEAIRALEAIARQPQDARRGDRPPLLTVRGNVPHAGATWFVDELTWSTEPEDTFVHRGAVTRTAVAVTLKRFAELDLVVARRPVERFRPYRVRSGDTLDRIAHEQCHARGARAIHRAARRIKQLNDLRDGRRIRPGTLLRIPAA